MFDAKNLLDALVRGAAPSQQSGQSGDLSTILGNLLNPQASNAAAQQSGQSGDLTDILGKLQQQATAGQGGGQGGGAQGGGAQGGGGLADILGKLQQQAGQSGGGLMDILGQVFAQATSGVKEGAQRIGDATGASDALGRAAGGQSADDLLAKLKDLINQNQLGAGAAAGGLGAVILGTPAGRALAASAIKLGGLALIGGLAYKALQNYQQGKPLITKREMSLAEAPSGSGFESEAISHNAALLYVRAMIAAAASDGRIDQREQMRIIGDLRDAGLGADAEQFLAQEINNPATIDELVAGVKTQEEAIQLFTAARLAIDVDTQEESDFLVDLAQKLQIDGELLRHIDSAAQAAAA